MWWHVPSNYLGMKPKKKIQDFNRIRTHDLAIPVRCSNQLSYEATNVGSRSIKCSYVPMSVTNVYEINHIWELQKCVHNCCDHSSFDFISVVLIYDLFHINLSHYRCNLIIIRINSKIIWAHKLCIRLEILSIMKTVKCIPYQIIIPLERLLIQFVYDVFQLFTHGGQAWRKNFWSSFLRAKITHVVAIFNTQQGVFTPFLSK